MDTSLQLNKSDVSSDDGSEFERFFSSEEHNTSSESWCRVKPDGSSDTESEFELVGPKNLMSTSRSSFTNSHEQEENSSNEKLPSFVKDSSSDIESDSELPVAEEARSASFTSPREEEDVSSNEEHPFSDNEASQENGRSVKRRSSEDLKSAERSPHRNVFTDGSSESGRDMERPSSKRLKLVDGSSSDRVAEEDSEANARVESRFGTSGQPLAVPGRVLLMDWVLALTSCKKREPPRVFYLFNDILVYGNIISKKYNQQHIIPLEDVAVSSLEDDGQYRNLVLIKTPTKSFKVYTPTKREKTKWMASINRRVQDHLEKMNSEANAQLDWRYEASGQPLAVPGRLLFLFNDILAIENDIVIDKKKHNQEHIIPLEHVSVSSLEDDGQYRNRFLIKTPTKSFAVYAVTAREKTKWMARINRRVQNLLENNAHREI